MQAQILKFLNITKESGISVAIKNMLIYLLRYSGLNKPDFKNWIKVRDAKVAFSCEIMTELPDTTQIPHAVGIVIHSDTKIGENVTIFQNVTIGRVDGENYNVPIIEDDVTILSGAAILGDVTIEKGAVIGANAVVLSDVKEDTTVVGAPAKEA